MPRKIKNFLNLSISIPQNDDSGIFSLNSSRQDSIKDYLKSAQDESLNGRRLKPPSFDFDESFSEETGQMKTGSANQTGHMMVSTPGIFFNFDIHSQIDYSKNSGLREL